MQIIITISKPVIDIWIDGWVDEWMDMDIIMIYLDS